MIRMIRKVCFCLLSMFFLTYVLVAAAQDISKVSEKDKARVKEMAQRLFPGISVDHVLPTPLPSLFAVTQGIQLVYLDPDHQLVFMGSMVDAKNQINLTEESRRWISKSLISEFDLTSALKEVHGDGKRVLIVFDDPYCKYCRQLMGQLDKVSNVTIYTYIIPILRESSLQIAHQIMCNPHPHEAWRSWMKTYQAPVGDISSCMVDGLKKNIDYAHRLGISSVPVIVFPSGDQTAGLLSTDDINKMLEKA